MLPFFSISDYAAARKGKSVPIEPEPKIAPAPPQIVDNRSLGQYLKDTVDHQSQVEKKRWQ